MLHEKSSIKLSSPFRIGGHELRNRTILAPMSGVSDQPFRELAWKYGAGMVVSEMIASQALLEGESEMRLKLRCGDIPMHVVQIAGREAKWMGLAAKMAQEQGAAIIDINMGCPAKRVTSGYSGSALMRDLDHAMTLIEATVQAVEVPVTLKMRLGWDDHSINAPELAKRAEEAGVQALTVHGRTRCQFYKGKADWQKVGLVRENTSLPLIVNGDVCDATNAEKAIQESGADAVMIGRASYGKPWLPGFVSGKLGSDVVNGLLRSPELAIQHHEAMLSFYGIEKGLRQARKHLGWYLDFLAPSEEGHRLRKTILTSFNCDEIHKLLVERYCMQHHEPRFVEFAA